MCPMYSFCERFARSCTSSSPPSSSSRAAVLSTGTLDCAARNEVVMVSVSEVVYVARMLVLRCSHETNAPVAAFSIWRPVRPTSSAMYCLSLSLLSTRAESGSSSAPVSVDALASGSDTDST
eukprot:Amastigsp_a677061_24.p5 type:complete len:122 gc:universal Amastigsp_a677061_24:555-190(-)